MASPSKAEEDKVTVEVVDAEKPAMLDKVEISEMELKIAVGFDSYIMLAVATHRNMIYANALRQAAETLFATPNMPPPPKWFKPVAEELQKLHAAFTSFHEKVIPHQRKIAGFIGNAHRKAMGVPNPTPLSESERQPETEESIGQTQ